MDPEADLGDSLGALEDALSQADFGPFEKMSAEVILPLLQALSDEKVLESLHVLFGQTRVLVEGAVQAAGGDIRVLTAALTSLGRGLAALKPVAEAVLPVAVRVYQPAVEELIEQRGGPIMAAVLNSVCQALNRNPEKVSRFVSQVFAGVDGYAFRVAADALVGALLDQRPPLAQWTAATVTRRVRNRVLARGGKRHGSN